MTETVTIVGSLAGLDLRATDGARVTFSIRYAPAGGAIEGDPVDGVTLPGPEYAPSIFTGTAWASTSAAGAWGRVLPWQEGAVIAVDVPGSGVRVAVCGTGPGEVPAGATVNFVDLPGAETLVEAPSTITATVAAAVADYLAANPPSGGGGVTDHGALTGLADDDHPQYALDADVTTALAGKVGLTDIRLTDARTPTAHAASHAAGGSDPVTVTSAQLADLTETVQDIVAALIAAGAGISKSYDDATGVLTLTATAGGGTTDPEVVRDTIGGALVQGAGITITVNDAGDSITIASTAVLPTRTVTAGAGLTGGGDLSANRMLAADFGATAGKVVEGNDARITGAAQKASNLSDLANAATARSNLGLGAAATREVGTTAGTVAAGDDPRFGAGSGIPAAIVDAKGDLLAGTGNDAVGRVAAGTNGQVLTADSSAAAGVSWQTVGGKVTSTTFPATGVFVEYPIPAAASMLELLLIGGGGGGGSGRRGATGTARCGGGGGASGAVTRVTLEVASLTAAGITSLWVRTDTAGQGGAAITVDGTSGAAGTAGGGSYVSKTASVAATEVVAYAGGGGGGGGGGNGAAGAAGGAGQANFGTSSGSAGAASSATGAAGSAGATGTAGGAPSGGSGGGLTSGNAASAGGAGGDARALPSGLAAAGGTTGGGEGGNGATALGGWINVGGGGGGGGTQASGAGGAGGAGGLYGGGGGGGAAATNGASSGAGGQGGAGVVRITAW